MEVSVTESIDSDRAEGSQVFGAGPMYSAIRKIKKNRNLVDFWSDVINCNSFKLYGISRHSIAKRTGEKESIRYCIISKRIRRAFSELALHNHYCHAF